MEQFRNRDTIIEASQEWVALKDLKGGRVHFSPGEGAKLRELVGTIWGMTSLPAMPDFVEIPNCPHHAKISKGVCEVKRREDLDGNTGFRFPLSECDWIIDSIDMGLAKAKDLFALNPQPRGHGAVSPQGSFEGDIIEGMG